VKTNLLPAIVPPDAAEVIHAYGDEIRVHLGGKHTAGQCTMFSDTTPPGGGPPPHFHVKEDEWWFVVEGRPSFLIDGRWREVPVGSCVFAPRNSLHTFKNAGDAPLRMVVHISPSGFESFFKKSEAEFQKGGAPDMKRLLEIGAEHGIYFPNIEADVVANQGTPALPLAVVQPGEGRLCRLFGEEITIQLDAKQTGGKFTTFVEVSPPGGGPPPHTFAIEDQWFFVLEGRMSVLADGRWTEVSPGTAFFAPRKSVHTFKNIGDKPSRMLVHTSPSGIEKFFTIADAEFAKPGGPDMARVMTIAAEHGLTLSNANVL
jgi:quercetin dioxygenase-like cupin family protein